MRNDNMAMLEDTLAILDKGYYEKNGKKMHLKLTRSQMEEAQVFLPEEIQNLSESKDFDHVHMSGRCGYGVENMDSFQLARQRKKMFSADLNKRNQKPILVLNLANPFNPGGGVRRGANAQEEDLCRKSSLLLSLESSNSAAYYKYNNALKTNMSSDAVIIHPQVEIIKDEKGELLDETEIVAVMTCAAPILSYGMRKEEKKQYPEMMLRRITGMLKVAAYHKYQYLVLGAFGCGAFDNDAHIVADLFYQALKEFDFDGMKENDMFRHIDFAVLDRTKKQYNYKEFSRAFENFYQKEDQKEADLVSARIREREEHLDAIRGCLFGGAVGDALGYPVEFLREKELFARYGKEGIDDYEKDYRTGKALISDDTQMVLFTANGLLVGDTWRDMKGTAGRPREYVAKAYHDWFMTQESTMQKVNAHERNTWEGGYSWLLDVPELYARRAPGLTCLSALQTGTEAEDYLVTRQNNSKGCGGVMRVAPVALEYHFTDIRQLDLEGAQLAAITHGHSLGFMPAAVLVHIINRIVFPPADKTLSLEEIVLEARDTAAEIFADDPHLPILIDILDRAVRLAGTEGTDDLPNIHQLGEGWVAEEALAISLYCALRHSDDFHAALTASVNHKGDSDSTGAITGNIMGALVGYEAIPEKWKKDLELSDVILEIADDLCRGCQISENSSYSDPAWVKKYVQMHR